VSSEKCRDAFPESASIMRISRVRIRRPSVQERSKWGLDAASRSEDLFLLRFRLHRFTLWDGAKASAEDDWMLCWSVRYWETTHQDIVSE